MTDTTPRHEPPDPEVLLEALKDMIRRRKAWDEPPELGFVYRANRAQVRTSALKLPMSVWERAGNPTNALRFLRQVLLDPSPQTKPFSDIMRGNAPAELCAVYMRTEGWAPPPHLVKELYGRRQAGGSTPRFETLPDRVEVRMCGAADAHGRRYMVMQQRGDSALTALHEGMKESAEVGGDQPELLRDITLALTGRPVPETGAAPGGGR